MNFLCVVPVYNEEEKLQQPCDEIVDFKKNNSNIEFLIINNGSFDGSEKIIKNSKLLYKTNEIKYGYWLRAYSRILFCSK